MSSEEQELPTTKNDEDKSDSSSQLTEIPVELKLNESQKDKVDMIKDKVDDSKPLNDAAKDCGDNSKQTTDNSSKPADLNKSSEFDDEDDFNSDELQLIWDEDDDEPSNDEKLNVKDVEDPFLKDSDTGNPSTSLVTAVKELENALMETGSKDVNVGSPGKEQNNTVANKEEEGHSSKKILDDIDKLIGNDEINKAENNVDDQSVGVIAPTVVKKSTEDAVISIDSSSEPLETYNPEAIFDPNNETDVGSVSSKRDSVAKEDIETKNPADTINLDDSTESLEIINESSLLSSTINESFLEACTKIEHGLKKPDMMLEIPTQELIDCMDDFDSDSERSDDKLKTVDVSKQISSLEKDIDDKIVDSTIKTMDHEITDKRSDMTEKDENVNKQVDSRKFDIESKIQDSESVENISNFTEKDAGNTVAKEPDSQIEIEMMDQQTADITSESNTKDQDPEKKNDDAIVQEATNNIKDSVNDVEMSDVSDKNEGVIPNTESDKAMEINNVENTNKIIEEQTKNTTIDDSTMEVDELNTPEKELKPAPNPEESKDLEKEHTLADANIKLDEAQSNEKSDNNPQTSVDETTKQTDEIVDTETSEQARKLNARDLELKSEIQETSIDTKPTESMDISQESDAKQQSFSAAADQKCVKEEHLSDTVDAQTIAIKLEHASEEINESIKNEPTDQSSQDATTTASKNTETVTPALDDATVLKEASSVEIPTPTLDPISSEQKEKDPELNEPSTSTKSTPNEESAPILDSITTEQKEKDPVINEPSTSTKPTSNEEPSAPILDSITTEQKEKDPVVNEPSTSIKPTSNEEPAPILDSITTERKEKDPVLNEPSTSTKPTSNEEQTAPILDSITTEQKEKDPVVNEPSTSIKPTSNEEPAPILDSITTERKSEDQVLDQPSTSKEPTDSSNVASKTLILDPVSTESKDPVDQSSTSKLTEKQMDQIPDTTDEVPEMEDTLGLLAESSRVVDADAEEGSSEGGEAEEDEEGDDDDFDPDEESSNQMTAEHSEESNAQPDKEDGQTDKEDKTPEQEKEFNFAIAAVTSAKEEHDDKMEVSTEDAKAADVVSVPTEAPPATAEETADKETPAQEQQQKDADTVKVSEISDNETEAATNSILKELLSKEAQLRPEMLSKLPRTSAEGVVDLESSSEDDEAIKKKAGQVATSTDREKEAQKDKSTTEETPEQKDALPVDDKATTKAKKEPTANAEVFNLDSDDDDVPSIDNEIIIEDKPESNKCINPSCRSGARTTYVLADAAARAYFDAGKKKKHKVCLTCAETVAERTKGLVNGIKEFTPLMELDLRKVSSETVEISDSDSDNDETETIQPEIIGESGAKFLEEHLADVINETWLKYKLDERLGDAQSELDKELEKLEAESKEIDTMLNECQVATDLLRNQLYATFEPERRELTAICIVDTPTEKYSFCETVPPKDQAAVPESNRLKRKSTAIAEQPAKRPAIPLGYTPLEPEDLKSAAVEASNVDDDKDVSVVKLSAESAPSDLPPPGEIVRQPLRAGMSVFAMRNSFCTWVPGKITEMQPKNPGNPFTMCRVRFEIRQKIATRVLAARCLAYLQPADVRLTIGTRVIALSQENAKAEEASKKKTFYSGIVAEIPNPVNSYRYLIFFDHGYAQYVHHRDTRVVCESSNLVWEEVHPNSREFVKQYLLAYPERPMVRLHAGQSLKTEWNGKWWVTKVLQVDASLVEVSFEDNRSEWIYRGSTRLAPLFLELQAAERQRARPLPRSNQRRMNMPYVEYTRSEEQNKAEAAAAVEKARQEQQNEEMRRQRAVAKKSTSLPPAAAQHNLDSVTSRVVYYTPKNAVKPLKMTPHTCSPKCKRSDVLALKDLRTYNPLAKPLLSGWERQIVRFKGHKEVMYRAPCGRRLRNMRELHRYLRAIQSDMGVDLFDFGANTHCLAEFVLNKCLVGKKDLSHGKENVPVPCVNYYDESLPEFCSYNTERTPTAGVPLNLDPEFLCGCDCTDDCEDKSKCACWKMTLEGARTIGLQGVSVGYEYKRLPEPLPSGIYECNSRCKCKQTCLNRVAQHPLQLKLQVFKTMNRGWGIRALNDVPKGSFLCVYAGNLLTDATANLDGLNEGDEYLAELDYIEVVEQMKEGYEEDIPEADKKLDRESSKSGSEEEEEPSSEEEDSSNDKEDGDFQPGYIGLGLTEFNKRLRKRDRTRKKEADKKKGKEIDKGMEDDGCITISDDEEAKEPTQFTAQTGIGANEFVPKYKSVRTLFGKDEACYIMDAKVQGNIGRYLNHSCTPNVFVQNVFVDTHDPRFPWVAFFALSHIRAGTELTWNYNYDVGSVPGKVLYCYCGAPNCRGRLL